MIFITKAKRMANNSYLIQIRRLFLEINLKEASKEQTEIAKFQDRNRALTVLTTS